METQVSRRARPIQVAAGKQTLLFDPKMQLLASLLLTGGLSEFLPSTDNETVIRYIGVERVTGDEPTAVRNFLENLASGGILERRFVKRLMPQLQFNALSETGRQSSILSSV